MLYLEILTPLRRWLSELEWLSDLEGWLNPILASPILVSLDAAAVWILTPLATAILIGGLDDLFVDAAWGWMWLKSRLRRAPSLFPPGPRQLASAPVQSIALFLPLWQEDAVIERMLEHNLGAIRYRDYHIFAGCYPNDAATQAAVRRVAARFSNVHLVLCPHPGPTSKADCLNWVYQHLEQIEREENLRFDVILTHDAEDIIHPEELRWVNYYSARYDFVQTPVLPLQTPLRDWTHGIYCDEFAEYHTRDMPVRAGLGSFVPSCGVGTGYRREALDKLAAEYPGQGAAAIFTPGALTEDYDNGLRLNRLGCSQAFIPITFAADGDIVATREYFPRNVRTAIRQRTRWSTGIALQSWERFGWTGTPLAIYWLWRDRKGLLANPLSSLANLIFFYGLFSGIWMRATPLATHLALATFAILLLRTIIRIACVARIYGLLFALGVPIRAVLANVINTAATIRAVAAYLRARIHGSQLAWLKTDHFYPDRAVLLPHKRPLGEILVSLGHLQQRELDQALHGRPRGIRFGEYLVASGRITSSALYEALSIQQGLPLAKLDHVPASTLQALPRHLLRRWRLIPFGFHNGAIQLASPELPSPEMLGEIGQFTHLEPQLHLISPEDYQRLSQQPHSA